MNKKILAYENAYRQCDDKGKINLLSIMPRDTAFSIITAHDYCDITDDYLKEHIEDITPELVDKAGNKFSSSLIYDLFNRGTYDVKVSLIKNNLIRDYALLDQILYLRKDSKLMLANEAVDPEIRAKACLARFNNKDKAATHFLINKDYEAFIELAYSVKIDLNIVSDEEMREILIVCDKPYAKITKELVENISSYGAYKVIESKTNCFAISRMLFYKEGVEEFFSEVCNKGLNNLLYDFGSDMPDKYFMMCSAHTINSVIRYYLEMKENKSKAARLYLKAAELRPESLYDLPYQIVDALDGDYVKSNKDLVSKSLRQNDRFAFFDVMRYDMDEIIEKLNRGDCISFREVMRLNIG